MTKDGIVVRFSSGREEQRAIDDPGQFPIPKTSDLKLPA
jgi:hypothetical protein